MSIYIDLDEQLLAKAMEFGAKDTKEKVINAALTEYIQRREQFKITELFGTEVIDEGYNYEAQRRIS